MLVKGALKVTHNVQTVGAGRRAARQPPGEGGHHTRKAARGVLAQVRRKASTCSRVGSEDAVASRRRRSSMAPPSLGKGAGATGQVPLKSVQEESAGELEQKPRALQSLSGSEV